MITKTSGYTILVLTDFSEASNIALRNAAKLVKLVNGHIQAHHVAAIKTFAVEENQLNLKRRLIDSHKKAMAKAQQMIASIAQKEGVQVNFTMDWGNAKNCISQKIKETNPDLVILGRRKEKILDFVGDKVTQYIVDHCDTNVLISGNNQELHSFSDLSLGFYGESIEIGDLKIIDHLQESQQSIKYFGIKNKMSEKRHNDESQQNKSHFIFSKDGSNTIEALTSYVERTNTQLFCIHKKNNLKAQPVREMVKRLNIPILLYK